MFHFSAVLYGQADSEILKKIVIIAGNTLPCAAGYVCLGGSDVATPTDGVMGYPCPVGFYCPEGSPMEISCNKGSYAPAIAMGILHLFNDSGPGSCNVCIRKNVTVLLPRHIKHFNRTNVH